jgi:hypothetical protein
MIRDFKSFLKYIIMESLHPELMDVIKQPSGDTNISLKKQTLITKKVQELTKAGQKTGIEGNMPKGSSRAYLRHEELHDTVIDGQPQKIKIGTKVAISADLDKYHNKTMHDGKGLGELQNEAEAGDHYVNSRYRMLIEDSMAPNKFTTNKENGIFPPLISHDHESHQWSQVGHADDITENDFRKLTETKKFPKGISHREFYTTLNRQYDRNNGKYWAGMPSTESHMDHIETHPLLTKFMDYHGNTGHPSRDLEQIQNMGVWTHPDGSKHIVARDHGFSNEVALAYQTAHKKKNYKGDIT